MKTATGKSGRRLLRLLEFDFVKMHRPHIVHQAADAVSRLATYGADKTELDDDIPILLLSDQEEHTDRYATDDGDEFIDEYSRASGRPDKFHLTVGRDGQLNVGGKATLAVGTVETRDQNPIPRLPEQTDNGQISLDTFLENQAEDTVWK